MSLLSRYGDLLRTGGAGPALAASLVGRLSLGMTGLGLLLLVRSTSGSYATAGAVCAAYALAFAAGSPARARSADRRGPAGVVVRCGLVHPVALVALTALATSGAPVLLVGVAAVAAGLTVPPFGAVMRALWGVLVEGPALATAFSLESVAVELCFIVGPALTAVLATTLGPEAAVLASALATLVGGLALGRSRAVGRVRPHPDAVHSLAGPLASAAVRALLLTVLWVGVGFGAVEVGLPAFVEAEGTRPGAAGLLFAVWSAGSVLGGLLYGALAPSRPAARQVRPLLCAFALGGALPFLAWNPYVIGLALFLYGMTIAPFFAVNSLLLNGSAPTGTATEAFAWSSSMVFAGVALGSALAGLLVESTGPQAALALTAVAGALTLATSLAGRRWVSAG
ncbi:MAG: transporter [Frankiales bacterium]|jgi:MFS family permease|nr:transporter [Frankiales bacterium]